MMRSIERRLARLRRHSDASDLFFRVLFSLIFIVGGLGHFGRTSEMRARIEESPWADTVRSLGDPNVLLWLSGVVLVLGGICLALGAWTRVAALALLVTLIPITISIHVAPGHVGPLLKNVAIFGGLIHFIVRGAGAYAMHREPACAPSPADRAGG